MGSRTIAAFSLLEMMVALVFMGLLMGGMVRVFVAGQKSWNRVNEGLTAQRALRWSLGRLAEDAQMMGHLFPPPELRSLDVAASADPALQSGFMLMPGRPICKVAGGRFAPLDPGEDPHEEGNRTADELSFVMDLPLPVRAGLDRAIPALAPQETGERESDDPAAAGRVRVRSRQPVSLLAGDLLVVAEDPFEFASVREPVTLEARKAAWIRVGRPDGTAGTAAFAAHHSAGARVEFVRPLRVVRYGVVYLALDDPPGSARPGPLIPCLVRCETAYPGDRAAPRWAALLASRSSPAASWMVVAEQVTGFQVDFSLDNHFPGIRGADYADTVARLQDGLRRRRQPGVPARDLEPFWFQKAGGLLRLTVETRSPLPRAEYGKAGAAPERRHLHRTQTLTLAPRNFGLGGAG